jgi:hypothetical protein
MTWNDRHQDITMPFAYRIFPKHRLVITCASGLVKGPEYLDFYRGLVRDSQCRPGFRELADLRQATAFDVDVVTLKQIADLGSELHGAEGMRTAVLINSRINEIISRLYQSIAEAGAVEDVRQFSDVALALEWLDRAGFPASMIDEVA